MALGEVSKCEPNWAALSGTVLSGGYEVGEVIEAGAHRATFRARVLGDWSAKALLNVFCAFGPHADEQVALWQAGKELQHANLSRPLAAGKFEGEGAPLIYAVVPGADETLASLLRERPVTTEEAREILTNLRRGLQYLHAHGWVHGHLSPEQVLAVDDSIRISSQYAHKINTPRPMELVEARYVAPEATSGNMTPAADVWCLGATLFEALTQTAFSTDRSTEIASLPAPFDEIVRKCLDSNPQTRIRIERIGADDLTQSAPPATNAAPKPAVSVTPVTESPTPVIIRAATRDRHPKAGGSRSNKVWVYGAILGLIVLALLWAARPRASRPVTVPHQVQTTATNATQQTATITPPPARDAPAPSNAVWRVIIFTYARESDAQKKAESVNKRHPGLDAKIFNPKGNGSPYLVTVGGKMTKDQAARLRERVIRLGLPRDSYIQNYK